MDGRAGMEGGAAIHGGMGVGLECMRGRVGLPCTCIVKVMNYNDIPCIKYYREMLMLGPGIVSTALQCGTGRCPTNNLTLNASVLITIHHTEEMQVRNLQPVYIHNYDHTLCAEDAPL